MSISGSSKPASTPTREQLDRYADLLVNYALGHGTGIKRGDVVSVMAPDAAKPLYVALCRAVWRAGGHVIPDYWPAEEVELNADRDFYDLASADQLDFFPAAYRKAHLDTIDHLVYVFCTSNPRALEGIDPALIFRHQKSRAPLVKWQNDKENAGAFTWTIGLYATPAMAAEAGASLEEYWAQVFAACFLDDADPIERWRQVNAQIESFIALLDALPIERLHVQGADCDLWVSLGEQRRWVGGRGANIPSYEIFTSPDWRGTEGWIRFSEPLYIHGSLVKGVELTFADGLVKAVRAAENEALIREMVATDGADRIGEFSLTDARLSRVTRFMANTLYDENVGGPFGNTHIALGQAIDEAYDGDRSALRDEDWDRLGFNRSVVHTDIVSTTDRTVTAVLRDGSSRVIYQSGRFKLD